jgi:hypothetical protein
MANRCTLHINKLEDFKAWLTARNIKFREGKGFYQVLQVETLNSGYQCIFSRHDMPEHYSVQDKLMPLVHKFLRETKNQTTKPMPAQEVSHVQ